MEVYEIVEITSVSDIFGRQAHIGLDTDRKDEYHKHNRKSMRVNFFDFKLLKILQ